ncbi:hypothetical protein TNCV_3219331 [Trichonephila clavipes]|nr:hypothetical protein TNCV_3219331 [Trichonephila clavipes]
MQERLSPVAPHCKHLTASENTPAKTFKFTIAFLNPHCKLTSFGVWSPRTAKTACTPVCHGGDEVIDPDFGEYCSTPQEVQSPSPGRSRRPWSARAMRRLEHVPNMLDWIQVRRVTLAHSIHCIVFSFKHVLHQTSSHAVGHYHPGKQKESPMALAARDDMRSKYLVCIPSARQSAITNDMQVRYVRLC